ncbi:MAG: hypothetical protein JRJ39_16680, partial [Deltaproteobacteria bacterium]|nr:hypothetical protein [Deltaproteobacteria bacterium]
MKTIEIDDEVFGYLQSKAIPFVETPNLTLRRLLLDDKAKTVEPKSHPAEKAQTLTKGNVGKKQ